MVQEAPQAADAHQLLGMALAAMGDVDGTERAFRMALRLAPGSDVVANNFARWLRQRNRLQEAFEVLQSATESPQSLSQQGWIALQLGDHARARAAFARALKLQPEVASTWHGFGNALRGLDQLEAAETAFRKVVALSPDGGAGWLSLGVVLRLLGRIVEALECLHRAETLDGEGAELQDVVNGVLHDLGRPADALAGARRLVSTNPAYVPGHEALARLLWENGDLLASGEDPLASLLAAARAQPGNRALQHSGLRMLLSARRSQEALDWLTSLRRQEPNDPLLGWYEADTRQALGDYMQAAVLYEGLLARLGTLPEFLNAYARHAFRAGKPELAETCAARAVQLNPSNQEAWSHLGLAWRLAGDPREYWLCDYDRLVGFVEVDAPDARGAPAFLSDLQATLEALHHGSREPINQSVRNGSQTGGRLFGRNNPVIRDAERALRAAVEGWLAGLPHDPRHPFLSRLQSSVRLVGSWSVRLRSSGRHANHIHNEGWLSSAFYVALPPSVSRGDGHAGWIQFGQPMAELGLDLPPRLLLQPQPGKLALFPSYQWHGTVPFDDPEPRLTIAFDMQPSITRDATRASA